MKTTKELFEVYKPKSPDEQKFIDKHVTIKIKDRNGNGDDVFNGNIKPVDRKKERHGYEPGEDEKVYESSVEKDLQDHEPRKVQGVYGAKSKRFEKKFKNQAHQDRFFDHPDREGNYEVHYVSKLHEEVEELDEAARVAFPSPSFQKRLDKMTVPDLRKAKSREKQNLRNSFTDTEKRMHKDMHDVYHNELKKRLGHLDEEVELDESYSELHRLKDNIARNEKRMKAIPGIHPEKKRLASQIERDTKKHAEIFKKYFSKNEEVELGEAVEVSHTRYMRSHGKKASGGEGTWLFTHKEYGDAKGDDRFEAPRGKFSDAKKHAQKWAKEKGHHTVYVMEEVEELQENPWNQLGQRKPVGNTLPAPKRGSVAKHGKRFSEGDLVVPHAGPHAGEVHKVTSSRVGSVNIVNPNGHKYDTITVRAKHEHLSPATKQQADDYKARVAATAERMRASVKEEVEELDEAGHGKKPTPYFDYFSPEGRARTKAALDTAKAKLDQNKKAEAAKKIGVKEEVEDLDEVLDSSEKRIKYIKKSGSSFDKGDENTKRKRYSGAKLLARNQMANEEVEELDELSKSTLKSYLDKSKKGGKDYPTSLSFRRSIEAKGIATAKLGKSYKRRPLPTVKVMATKEEVELDEKHLTPTEMKKREEIAKAMAKENPNMPMGKKMAIATAAAKKFTKEDIINRTIEKYIISEEDLPTPAERLVAKLDGLSESHIHLLLDLFENLGEDNQHRMLEQVETSEGISGLLDFAIERRGA